MSDNGVILKTNPNKNEARLVRVATYTSVIVALFLIIIKIGAWLATDSISLLASLVDSMLDAGASLINLIAV